MYGHFALANMNSTKRSGLHAIDTHTREAAAMSDLILRDWGTETAGRYIARNLVAVAFLLFLPILLINPVNAQGPLPAPIPEPAEDPDINRLQREMGTFRR